MAGALANCYLLGIMSSTMAHYEVEIKTLLGSQETADALKSKMCELDPASACTSSNTQLNHYFEGGNIHDLYTKTEHLFTGEQHEKFKKIADAAKEFSVRTRQQDEEVRLVIKASLDEGTSANTVTRMEFEEPVSITLEELDGLVLGAGFSYQAKWSRAREEYTYKDATVCIDKNAGYGYLAEFEKIVTDPDVLPAVRADLQALMAELGVEELAQDRLARMFAHYNDNWADYYGTEKTFHIE